MDEAGTAAPASESERVSMSRNNYDRLRAIEEVALRLLDSPWISPDERSELAAAIYVESVALEGAPHE